MAATDKTRRLLQGPTFGTLLRLVPAVTFGVVRMMVAATGAFAAIAWLGSGPEGAFVAIAASFIVYGLCNAAAWRWSAADKDKAAEVDGLDLRRASTS